MKKQVIVLLDGTPKQDDRLADYLLTGYRVVSVTAGYVATGNQSTQVKVKGDFLLVLENDNVKR